MCCSTSAAIRMIFTDDVQKECGASFPWKRLKSSIDSVVSSIQPRLISADGKVFKTCHDLDFNLRMNSKECLFI